MPVRTAYLLILTLFFAPVACTEKAVLSSEAYGLVSFGSLLVDIERTLNESASRKETTPDCGYVHFDRYPGVEFMVERGIVTRAEVNATVQNVLEVTVGTPLEQIKKAHPEVIVRPHKYTTNGFYLIFKTENGKNAIVMEAVDGRIAYIRAGIEPSVEYVEGCL